MNSDVISKIQDGMEGFSKGQRAIARYILENSSRAAYMTAVKLGNISHVSESTVVRFATELGYEGYPHFQRALREAIRNKLNAAQRLELTEEHVGAEETLETVLNADIDCIRQTLDQIDKKAFQKAVEIIMNAEHIYVIGVRSAGSLASFLSFYLNLLFHHVKLIQGITAGEVFEEVLRISSNDVIIGLSFPRYSNRTINVLKYARSQGAHVIGITDSIHSPIHTLSDCTLICSTGMTSVVDSLVAPLSVINALVVSLCLNKKDELYATFDRLEKIWASNGVYQTYDET